MTIAPASFALFAGDTIAAIATPPGRGAISIIRISGANAHALGRRLTERWPDAPRVATLSTLRDASGVTIDQALVTRFDAPASFTGEDMIEISAHGGAVVPVTVLAALIAHGAREALPGEFTRRAVLNGKLDILQAEAIGDLVNATSRAAQQVALQQLDGGLSARVLALRNAVVGVEALVAYDIDFPEEDDGPIPRERIVAAACQVEAALEQLLATAETAETIREGALVVLAGAPNVGKSSLFNALLGRRRAIVTDIPGTTRDALEAVLDTGGWPLRLVDTAGLRHADELVERMGIEMSREYLARAAAVLACGEDTESLRVTIDAVRDLISPRCALIAVHTKSDLESTSPDAFVGLSRAPRVAALVHASAETGTGLSELLETTVEAVKANNGQMDLDAPLLTNARHRHAVARALEEMRSFREAHGGNEVPATIAAVHLREAATVLEELIGTVDIEQVLDEVFRRFCVGK